MPVNDRLRRLRWELFTATWLSYAGFYVTRKVFSVVKPALKGTLGLDDLALSHLFTAYLVAYMLGQFLPVITRGRIRARTWLLGGMLTSVACNAGIAALLTGGPRGDGVYYGVLALMTLHGLSQATGWPNNVALMTSWTTRSERGTVMAVWGTCYQLGGVAAKALAAAVFGAAGLAWAFGASSVVLAAVTALFWAWGRERPEDHGVVLASDVEGAVDGHPSDGALSGAAWRRWAGLVVAMGATYFAFKFLRYALDSWTSLILVERFAVSVERAGYLSTAFDWVGFLGVLAAGIASDRLFDGRRGPVVFGMTVGAFVATVGLWSVGQHSAAAFTLFLGLIGFLDMGPDSLLCGVGAVDVGDRRQAAMAVGVVNGLGSVGPIVQEPLIGWLKATWGLDAVFGLLVATTALAATATGALWAATRRLGVRW